MARQLLEIRNFNVGTIMSPDAADIPIEAASFSLNIDSVSEDGVLVGVPIDKKITLSNSNGYEFSPEANKDMSSIFIGGAEKLIVYNGGWEIITNMQVG